MSKSLIKILTISYLFFICLNINGNILLNENDKLANQKRLKLFKSIMKFMEIRVDLDLQGWEGIDIFAHK